MSWMDSWSRPSKHQATPAPFYLVPGCEDTPYCHSCGRVISARRADSKTPVKYCSSRCRSHKPGRLDREIESTLVGFLNGALGGGGRGGGGGGGGGAKKGAGRKAKGDARILVSCDEVDRHMFGAAPAAGTDDGDTDGSVADLEPTPGTEDGRADGRATQPVPGVSSGTLDDPGAPSAPPVDYDVLARLSVRSGTRVRPPQDVSEVNGSVGGEKGRAERVDETGEMLEKRREGLRRARQREAVRCAARRGVVFGFAVGDGEGEADRRKCEAIMLGKVVEPSFAKGDWGIRWRE